MKVLLDPHVHIYPSYNINTLLSKAEENFNSALRLNPVDTLAICLTERNDCNFYQKIKDSQSFGPRKIEVHGNHLQTTLLEYPLLLFPGQQVNTEEGLEVLALFLEKSLPNNLNLVGLVDFILNSGGLPVINWAPGKWLGRRGKYLLSALDSLDKRVALGITSLLPEGFPMPSLTKDKKNLERPVILGSDPLPFVGEERLVGSCGIKLEIEDSSDTHSIINSILSSRFSYFGHRDSLLNVASRLVRNEISRRF